MDRANQVYKMAEHSKTYIVGLEIDSDLFCKISASSTSDRRNYLVESEVKASSPPSICLLNLARWP
jgi:hypothetical protein